MTKSVSVILSAMTQAQALDILKTGGNIFLTGEPGAGKTYVINEYIAWLEACGLKVAVTATTGIAATHIGGMTIHAWSGIGAKDELSSYDLEQITTREKVVKRIKNSHVLVIDEISMLDGKHLESINRICKLVRQRPNEAFGGLQVVLVGDFFQLPPVTRAGQEMRYAFESHAWSEAHFLPCYLTEQFRQEDELFLSLLKSIRKNDIEEGHYTLLQEQVDIAYTEIEPTRLFTHNADVDLVNANKLKELSGMTYKFQMSARGSKPLLEGLVKNCLSPQVLELKEDAMVMCTKNNFEAGYVNGTLGRVVDFEGENGYPIIEVPGGRRITIKPTTWEFSEDNKVLAEIEQIPLRLAWAITVHKSQGMSLDAAEIDLSRAFVYGQGYVALSRVRSLDGLKMLGMHPNALQVDPKVVHKDTQFRAESDAAEEAFTAMEEDDLESLHEKFVKAGGGQLVKGPVTVSTDKNRARLQKESTYEITKQHLKDGKVVGEIAKERNMATSTIWSHVEKLIEEKNLEFADFKHLLLDEAYKTGADEILEALLEHGPEKLKPLYEATGEQFDYEIIRLARAHFLLSKGDKE